MQNKTRTDGLLASLRYMTATQCSLLFPSPNKEVPGCFGPQSPVFIMTYATTKPLDTWNSLPPALLHQTVVALQSCHKVHAQLQLVNIVKFGINQRHN